METPIGKLKLSLLEITKGFAKERQPKCANCGSRNVEARSGSKGEYWKCLDCGQDWIGGK